MLFAIDEAQSASIEELAALAVLYQQVLGDQDATGLSDSDPVSYTHLVESRPPVAIPTPAVTRLAMPKTK